MGHDLYSSMEYKLSLDIIGMYVVHLFDSEYIIATYTDIDKLILASHCRNKGGSTYKTFR